MKIFESKICSLYLFFIIIKIFFEKNEKIEINKRIVKTTYNFQLFF